MIQEAAESHPELRPHRVAVGPLPASPRTGALERYARAEADVDGPRTVVGELAGSEAPDLVLVNDDDLTYCKIRFDEGSLATLRAHLGDITDPLARALCWSALWNLTRDALMPARDFVDLVLRFAGRESDIGVLQMLHAWAGSALTHYAAPDWREDGRTAARRGRVEGAAARRTGQPAPADLGPLLRGRGVERGRSPAAPGAVGGHGEDRRPRRRPGAALDVPGAAGLARRRRRDDGRRRTRPRRHGVRQAPPGALPRRPPLGRGQGTGVGARSSSRTRCPTPSSRRPSRASCSPRSGSCSRRTRRSTSR